MVLFSGCQVRKGECDLFRARAFGLLDRALSKVAFREIDDLAAGLEYARSDIVDLHPIRPIDLKDARVFHAAFCVDFGADVIVSGQSVRVFVDILP